MCCSSSPGADQGWTPDCDSKYGVVLTAGVIVMTFWVLGLGPLQAYVVAARRFTTAFMIDLNVAALPLSESC